MNLEKIFTLFYIPDSDSVSTPSFETNPSVFHTLMFEKILDNKEYMSLSLNKIYSNIVKSTDKNAESTVLDIIHARSWSYIEKVKIREKGYKAHFKNRDNKLLIDILESEICYYESKEEYEKCAFLYKLKIFFTSLQK
jgi:hypothetical protein